MATVYVTVGNVGIPNRQAVLQIWADTPQTETITSSGVAASGNIVATGDQVAQIFCATPVIVATNGTATASNGLLVAGNVPAYIRLPNGKSISVIDA